MKYPMTGIDLIGLADIVKISIKFALFMREKKTNRQYVSDKCPKNNKWI